MPGTSAAVADSAEDTYCQFVQEDNPLQFAANDLNEEIKIHTTTKTNSILSNLIRSTQILEINYYAEKL